MLPDLLALPDSQGKSGDQSDRTSGITFESPGSVSTKGSSAFQTGKTRSISSIPNFVACLAQFPKATAKEP
jgi:hypothetical protein